MADMAIRIYEERKQKQKKDVYLKLRQEGDAIVVIAVDETGKLLKNILDISKKGIYLRLFADGVGIATDSVGKVIIL